MSNEFNSRYEGLKRSDDHECGSECMRICDGCNLLMCADDTEIFPRRKDGDILCPKCFEAAVILDIRNLVSIPGKK